MAEASAQRCEPIGFSGVQVALISRFSVSGRRAMSASPPAVSADANPAAISLSR